jgi:hypothetical protein
MCPVVMDLNGSRGRSQQASTPFKAAAVAAFRLPGWAAEALTPNALLHIEVQLPPITHDVPLKAIDRWGGLTWARSLKI